GEAPWKRLRVLTASSSHGAAAAPQPMQRGSLAAAELDTGGGRPTGGYEAPGHGAAATPHAATWSAEDYARLAHQVAAASWAAQPGKVQQAPPSSAPDTPCIGSAGAGFPQDAHQAETAGLVDPLFPEFARICGQGGEVGGQGAGQEEEKRYDRFLRLLPDGSLSSD
ncbi:unnamed protein product, partial [Prorocentrum cordatum]